MKHLRIALFQSTYETLRGEEYLKKHQIPFRPVIKPRSISSECSMGLEFDAKFMKKVITLSEEENLYLSGIYSQHGEFWEKVY